MTGPASNKWRRSSEWRPCPEATYDASGNSVVTPAVVDWMVQMICDRVSGNARQRRGLRREWSRKLSGWAAKAHDPSRLHQLKEDGK